MTDSKPSGRVERAAALRWVPIEKMRVSPVAQREINSARVDRIVATFDLEQIGTPTVSARDEVFYIIDGQHRIEALRQIGWGDQQVQCWTYNGLTEQDEAEKFLKINDTLAVSAFYRFRVGVQAGREAECDVDRIVRAQELRVSLDSIDGAVSAVGTLMRVYHRSGPAVLARALRVIRDAYGDAGLEAIVIDGVALVCQRYSNELQDGVLVARLAKLHGGVHGLLGKAEGTRRATGHPKAHCVAAATVDVMNAGRGGNKLPSFWVEAA